MSKLLGLTLQEIEDIIKSNMTITDQRLHEAVYSVAVDIEMAVINKNDHAGKVQAAAAELERAESVAHLGGVSMHQEDLNEMMRLPGERVAQQKIQVPTCPRCGERYCGDGVLPCLECKATEKQE